MRCLLSWIGSAFGLFVVWSLWGGCGAVTPPLNSVRVTRQEYGEKWPLTVEAGTIYRHEANALTFKTDDGTVYALNGTAKGWKLGEDIRPIWTDDPRIEGTKINIGPLIERGHLLPPPP